MLLVIEPDLVRYESGRIVLLYHGVEKQCQIMNCESVLLQIMAWISSTNQE